MKKSLFWDPVPNMTPVDHVILVKLQIFRGFTMQILMGIAVGFLKFFNPTIVKTTATTVPFGATDHAKEPLLPQMKWPPPSFLLKTGD